MTRAHNLDARLFRQVAVSRLQLAHPVLPRLSRAADHGVLWMAAAGALAATRNRTARRAALRGLGALALASATVNIAAKSATRRQRPILDQVPVIRRLTQQPNSSSFPSGHAASAAAFATGIALESPLLGLAVAPVAAAVAASRVYVGVHYPGDVLVGAAMGVGIAALTTRWWPLRDDAPITVARPRVPAPALPGGAGLTVVVNEAAGSGSLQGPAADQLRTLLPQADLRVFGPQDDLAEELAKAADSAQQAGGALGVCGGDGTVGAAATLAARRGLPLAVFPGGTLNHFALDLGLETLAQACAAVESGSAASVDLGLATGGGDQAFFLNTFSIGAYPDLVRARESLEQRLGKWPAMAVGLAKVLADSEPVRVRVNGVPRKLWLLFAGNGSYEPSGFAPSRRSHLDDGLLDVRVVDGSTPLARARLLAAFLTGTLGRSRIYHEARLSELQLDGLGDVGHFAYDGEVAPAPGSLRLSKARQALTVYRPA